MNSVPTIHEAIERLYQVFARYTLPVYTDPRLHCHTIEDEAKLHSKPLRLLQWEDLKGYASDALSVWGDVDTFKHLLPRLFDLFLYSDDPETQYLDPEILFGKFRHGRWREWPPDEQIAVEQFLQAIWNGVFDDPPTYWAEYSVDTWLCAIGQAEDDLSGYLNEWFRNDDLDATLALSRLAADRNGFSPFWDGRELQLHQLQQWITSDEVTRKVHDADDQCDPSLDPAK